MAAEAEFQLLLARLAADLGVKVERLMSSMGRLTLMEAMRFVTDAYPDLARPYLSASGELSTQWYTEQPAAPVRPGAGVFKPVAAPLLPDAQLGANARWALTQRIPSQALSGAAQGSVFQQSRDTVVFNVDREHVKWARHASANACAFCRMLATRGAVYGSADNAKRGHAHCIIAGTLVSGPSTRAAYRRWYEGEVVTIHTASGENLTITPNHPVLTDKGWVPAGLLNEGCNVLRPTSGQARVFAVPDEYQHPSLIEDVWGSLAVSGLAQVPLSTQDFHGDGLDSKVEVVWSDRYLRDRVESEFAEPPPDLLLTRASVGERGAFGPHGGGGAAGFPRMRGAANSVVRGGCECGTFMGRGARHAEPVSLAGRANIYTHLGEPPTDHHSAGVETLRYFQLRKLVRDIQAADVFTVDVQTVPRRFDPAGAEFSIENGSAYSELGRDLLHRLGGQVEVNRVVQVARGSFSGHVYNLDTVEGWYSASSTIVSNCHCVAVPDRDGTYKPAPYVADWTKQYYQARKDSGSGDMKAILSAWRSATDAA